MLLYCAKKSKKLIDKMLLFARMKTLLYWQVYKYLSLDFRGEFTLEKENIFNADAIKLLLDTAKSEYESEHNRTTIIDSKISISLPIISAYFFALAQLNDYKTILNIKTESFCDFIYPAFLFVVYTASLALALVSVIKMVYVIATRQYQTIKPSDLYSENFLKNEPEIISIQLIMLYIEATEENREINSQRIPLYRRGWICATLSIILYVAYIIIQNNI